MTDQATHLSRRPVQDFSAGRGVEKDIFGMRDYVLVERRAILQKTVFRVLFKRVDVHVCIQS